ncbi:MAG: DMT family transporter [Bacteroidota bacterium]
MDLQKKSWQWIILLILAFTWGSSFIMMKKGLQSFSSNQVAALRMFISFVLLLPFIIYHIKAINRKHLLWVTLVGVFGNFIPAFFYTAAQTKINSSLAGMLNALTPIFTLIVGLALFKTKSSLLNILGLIIGLVGAAGLAVTDISDFFEGNNWYGLFAVAATLCYGFNVNLIKEKLKDLSGIQITALAFLFIGPAAGIWLLFSGFETAVQADGAMTDLMYIFLLALFSSVLAVIVMNILLKHVTAIFFSTVTYIIPIFAIIWGLIDGEGFLYADLIWITIVLAGVYMVNIKRRTK